MTLLNKRLEHLHKELRSKNISVSDLVDEAYAAIAKKDQQICAYLTLNEEFARHHARQLDDCSPSSMSKGGLFGLPVGIKDNILTKGLRTTCGSKYLQNFHPVYDATVVEKLVDANCVILGKLNMDEFGMGSSTENSSYGPTRNPWDLNRVPGGSSGGSAAAVAAGEAYFTLGSDTGGSIRQPAAYCGVVGLKPTYGLVSRFGLVAFASSLDHIGPITKNVEDAAYVLQSLAGYDCNDCTSARVEVPDYRTALHDNIKGLRIGVPEQYIGIGVDPEVKEKIVSALSVLERLGAQCEEVSLPHTEYAVAAYYILASSEASSNLARFDGIRYGEQAPHCDDLFELYYRSRTENFGSEVKRRIMLGTYALSSGFYDAHYAKAQKVRTLIKKDFDQVFSKYDVIIGPTAPTTAFRFGSCGQNPLTMYQNDILTIPISLAGLPAITVPCGFVEGMPVGLQVIGKPFNECTILRVAHAFEQNTHYHTYRATL